MDVPYRAIDAFGPVVLTLAAAVLGTVAMAACLIPARSAARVEPTVALRSE